jgi:hypothetical protein
MIPHALHGDEDPDEGEYLPFDMGAPRTAPRGHAPLRYGASKWGTSDSRTLPTNA